MQVKMYVVVFVIALTMKYSSYYEVAMHIVSVRTELQQCGIEINLSLDCLLSRYIRPSTVPFQQAAGCCSRILMGRDLVLCRCCSHITYVRVATYQLLCLLSNQLVATINAVRKPVAPVD